MVELKVTTKIYQKISAFCFQMMQTISIYQFYITAKRRWKTKLSKYESIPSMYFHMQTYVKYYIYLYNTSYSLVDAFFFYSFHKVIEAL